MYGICLKKNVFRAICVVLSCYFRDVTENFFGVHVAACHHTCAKIVINMITPQYYMSNLKAAFHCSIFTDLTLIYVRVCFFAADKPPKFYLSNEHPKT